MNFGTFILVLCAVFSVANLGFAIHDYVSGSLDGSSLFSAFIGGVLLAQTYYHAIYNIGMD